VATKEIRNLKLEREHIRARHAAAASGTFIVRQLSDALDTAVIGLWERLVADDSCALIALGEYGRQEVSPASSLDLLILHPWGRDPTDAAKALSYELWGAELDLGYAVYTPEEALRLARTRLDSELRFLDARLLVGDAALFKDWKSELMGWSRRSPEGFLDRLGPVTRARRSSTDDACSCLEPDLMDGAGGLADLATIRWIEAVAGPREIPSEPGALTEAAELLHRVRNELHYITGRNTDVLQMQYHVPVAEALAPHAPVPVPEVELMRTLYESCRTIAFALDSLLSAGDDGGQAGTFVSLFPLGANAQPIPKWSTKARESFVGLLSTGPEGRAGFRALERRGALATALPEWDGIRCLPQRSVYHRYAVDVHCYEVVAELAELRGSADELTRRVARESEADRETLLLAGLLHDIGKGSDEDHCLRGEMLARSAMDRMGIEDPQASEVVWLVRNHLLLSRVATRRDIGDEALAVELADRIGSERRLRLLYLLTVADARATGPAAWSTWKSTLISRLFTRIAHVLRRGELAGADTSEVVADKIDGVKAALSGYPPAVLERHLADMPRAWLLSQSQRGLVDQSIQLLEFHREEELRIRAVANPEAGIWEATVVANDRPGLFSRVAGVLALHKLSVLGAEIYTRDDGVALEIFQLEPKAGDPLSQGAEEDKADMDSIAEDARMALRGRLSLDARHAELRRGQPEGIFHQKRPDPEIVVDDDASDFFTVVEVRAADRIGLLYTITRALVEMELDIALAKVSTYGEEVVDVFYVRDFNGHKVTDPLYAEEIARSIRFRLT
jgi:[protein-PII] uridylyltransferase